MKVQNLWKGTWVHVHGYVIYLGKSFVMANLFVFVHWDKKQKKDLQEFIPIGLNDPEIFL